MKKGKEPLVWSKHCAYVSEINGSFTFLNLFRFIYIGLYMDLNVEVRQGSMLKSLFFRHGIYFFTSSLPLI